MKGITIRRAIRADYEDVTMLLRDASLPTSGIDRHFDHFFVAVNDRELVGTKGLERYGETGLLRSAVVHPGFRGSGIGTALFSELLVRAQALGTRRLLLLTTTAEEYFRRKGFRPVERKSITGPVTASEEFTGACPETAVCMELTLWK